MKIAGFCFSIILLVTGIVLLPHLLFSAAFGVAALFTPSPIMNELRKKAGSDVFSKNHYGAFIRKRVKGTNPRSVGQLNVRANLSSLAKGFKSLGAGPILAWNTYGQNFTFKNRLGQNIKHTGEVWYIKLNRILLTMSGTPITSPPSTSAVPPALMVSLAVTATSGTAIGITYTTFAGSNTKGVIMASRPLSAGKAYNSDFRYLAMTVAADSGVKDLTSAYTTVFGGLPVTGQKVFVKVFMTDFVTGLRNSAQEASKVV
jgi:uncharacterized membrane protein